MKNLVIGFFSIMILLLSGAIIGSIEGRTMRQNELSSTLSSAMQQSMEILMISKDYEMKDAKEFTADFIQNAMIRMNSKSDYQVEVYNVDVEKGLLDAKVTQTYDQLIKKAKVSARHCMVLDDYTNSNNEYFTVTFKKDGTILKQVSIHGGDFLSSSILPVVQGVSSWEMNGIEYTADNIKNVSVTKDMVLIAK